MKFRPIAVINAPVLSLPVRGAWIEIMTTSKKKQGQPRSLPVRGAWIEIPKLVISADIN